MRVSKTLLFAVTILAITFQISSNVIFASPAFQERDPFGNETSPQDNPFADSDDPNVDQKSETANEKANPPSVTIESGDPEAIKSVEEIIELLNQPITLKFDEATFADISDSLSERLGVAILLDQTAQDDSLMYDDVLSYSVENIPLSNALRFLLDQHNACMLFEEGVIRIISKDFSDDSDYYRTKVFDCRELLISIGENSDKFPPFPSQQNIGGFGGGGGGLGGGGLGGGGFGGGGFGGGQVPNAPKVAEQSKDKTYASNLLIDCIKRQVDSNVWDTTQGDATITSLGGLFIVSGKQHQLAETEKLLDELKSKFDKE